MIIPFSLDETDNSLLHLNKDLHSNMLSVYCRKGRGQNHTVHPLNYTSKEGRLHFIVCFRDGRNTPCSTEMVSQKDSLDYLQLNNSAKY